MSLPANRFVLERTQHVDALDLSVEAYSHPSGASHFHLSSDYDENVFMVAFRTVPGDSTGVAHILEHTVLCGSEKFPVRDPFFLMIRRSLNTFMNAFTTSDYTAYPFASQNRKDYRNLMEVYLDAVFFSRLDPLDFAQEGHRVEFEQADDPATPLVYKGVVFNEMKGDTSSPMSMLYHGVQEQLFPTSTYHYNSGGDPAHIPDLSYEALLDFYRTHYQPGNAVFMTFGNIAAAENQVMFEEYALSRLNVHEEDIKPIAVTPEVRYRQPVSHEFGYPVDDDDLDGKTHIVLGWLLGPNTDLEMLLKCHLLSDVLLDTSASPLRHALEKTPLARGASPLCGFEEDHFETSFVCGVEGSEPEHAEAVEQLILDVLEKVAEEGIDESRLQAVLHQLELSQREIGGDGYPYGLQLIFSCMSAAIHRGDPIGLLNIDPVIEHLKEQIREPDFIRTLVRELLLDNPHRVRVTMKPDRQLGKILLDEERARLEALRRSLGDDQVEDIKRLAAKLKERQAQEDDLDLLPQVTREDIPRQGRFVDAPAVVAMSLPVVAAEAGTNGIGYHQLTSSLPPMTLEQLTLLPVYTQVVTEIGSAGRGYLETQHLQHESTGGISAFATVRALPDDASCYRGYLTLSSRTLNPRAEEMVRLVQETALSPDFDEPERLKELVTQLAMRRMNAVAGNGHQYAMSAAAAGLSPVGAINDYLAGIPGIRRLSELAKRLESGADLGTELAQLHGQLRQHDPMALAIADPGHVEPLVSLIDHAWADHVSGETPADFAVPQDMALPADAQAFVVTTQVNFCATAFPTVAESHDDSAALTVLAGVLRNSFLHTEIREKGGAYGGGAGHDSSNGVFRFYSYRDPRLMQTFATFEQAIDWVQRTTLTDAMLEEAILQIIGSIDSPGSPAGEIRQAFHHGLYGRDAAHRRAMRQRIIDVRPADLKRVASEYLQVAPRRAVVLSENRLGELENSFEIVRLN